MDTALDALAKPGRQNIPNIAQDVEKTATGGDIVAHTPTSQGPLIVERTLYAGNQFPLSGLAGKQQIVISSPPQPPTIGAHQQRGETRMSSAESIRKAVVATAYLTDKISPDDRSAPTPCDQFNLHGLVSHMADVFAMSAAAATKNGPTTNPPEQVTPYDSLTESLSGDKSGIGQFSGQFQLLTRGHCQIPTVDKDFEQSDVTGEER